MLGFIQTSGGRRMKEKCFYCQDKDDTCFYCEHERETFEEKLERAYLKSKEKSK